MRWVENPDYSMFPRPHEGVRGIDRSDDPLMSLEPDDIAAREAVRVLGLHLRSAVMVGQPAPVVQRMSQWMKSPRAGDLVTEESTAYRDAAGPASDNNWPFTRMGYLVLVREEWACTDEEFEAEPYGQEEGRGTDKGTYIQYGPDPADVCRWVNCSFFAIPTDLRQFDLPIGEPTPAGGVMLTRDDLFGALSDSGFELKLPPPTDV